jgi:hypothetical protein
MKCLLGTQTPNAPISRNALECSDPECSARPAWRSRDYIDRPLRRAVLAPPLTQRGRPFGRNMWDQISEFLFDNYAVAGFQFENWMWVIGVPALLTFGYFFERGFGNRPADPTGN